MVVCRWFTVHQINSCERERFFAFADIMDFSHCSMERAIQTYYRAEHAGHNAMLAFKLGRRCTGIEWQ